MPNLLKNAPFNTKRSILTVKSVKVSLVCTKTAWGHNDHILRIIRKIIRLLIKIGGARRDRTDDLLRARQALSQLSYGPFYKGFFKVESQPKNLVGLGGFEPPTSPLSGVRSNQLSYRPN